MSSPPNHKLALYYTSEDSAITRDYNVLSAPPPGVFPPPQIILPPPLPSNYVQTDLSDYWVDDNFEDPDNENALRCYQLRANFTGNPPFGIFCDVVRFYFGVPGQEEGGEYGSGNWNRGSVSISFGNGEDYTGQVFDQAASKLVLTDPNGRQLILVNDASKNCASLGGPTGPCQE